MAGYQIFDFTKEKGRIARPSAIDRKKRAI